MKRLILDFDGVVASMKRPAEKYKKALIECISEKSGINAERVKWDFASAIREVRKNPSEYGWIVNGYKAILGDEDLYALMGSAADALYNKKQVYRFCSPKAYQNFTEKTFNMTAGATPSFIDYKTRKAVKKLQECIDVTIISNGRNARIGKALEEADLKIDAIGEAKKMIIDPTFDKVDRYLRVGSYDLELRRPYYYKALKSLRGDKIVVGDVLSLDLSLPYSLGMDIVMKVNSYTPKWSRKFVASKGKVVRKLDDLLRII